MITSATPSDFETVKNITQTTIREIYPRYYPAGAVEMFCEYHSDESIAGDIAEGCVYLLKDDGFVGTVTVKGNHISRLFVLPGCQHKGYGRALLDFAEEKVLAESDSIELDASFPAKKIYIKRGYKEISYNIEDTGHGDYLCYDVMRKERSL